MKQLRTICIIMLTLVVVSAIPSPQWVTKAYSSAKNPVKIAGDAVFGIVSDPRGLPSAMHHLIMKRLDHFCQNPSNSNKIYCTTRKQLPAQVIYSWLNTLFLRFCKPTPFQLAPRSTIPPVAPSASDAGKLDVLGCFNVLIWYIEEVIFPSYDTRVTPSLSLTRKITIMKQCVLKEGSTKQCRWLTPVLALKNKSSRK